MDGSATDPVWYTHRNKQTNPQTGPITIGRLGPYTICAAKLSVTNSFRPTFYFVETNVRLGLLPQLAWAPGFYWRPGF